MDSLLLFPERYAGKRVVISGVEFDGNVERANGGFFVATRDRKSGRRTPAFLAYERVAFQLPADAAEAVQSFIRRSPNVAVSLAFTIVRVETRAGDRPVWSAVVHWIGDETARTIWPNH